MLRYYYDDPFVAIFYSFHYQPPAGPYIHSHQEVPSPIPIRQPTFYPRMSLQCSFLTGFIHPPNKQTNKQTFRTITGSESSTDSHFQLQSHPSPRLTPPYASLAYTHQPRQRRFPASRASPFFCFSSFLLRLAFFRSLLSLPRFTTPPPNHQPTWRTPPVFANSSLRSFGAITGVTAVEGPLD
jgi:hypothetical protein